MKIWLGILSIVSVFVLNVPAMADSLACTMKSDTVLIKNAVGPAWIPWESPCLPNADLVYVDTTTWDIWVMDERGGDARCLTCYNSNIFGVNFPLDDDGRRPDLHWKGDPEVHATAPIILFKAENERSEHRRLTNAPSIGWDNDIWALNVCTKRYSRLTTLARGEGLQHTAISHDGTWYVYPRRYKTGVPLRSFGLAAMSFNTIEVDGQGDAHFTARFEAEPNGAMYYEPIDIRRDASGTYTLLYVAGEGTMLDPYRYDWSCQNNACSGASTLLQATPDQHEEFMMFSPSGTKIPWMRGPVRGLGYHADLYVSNLDFSDAMRVTWYNDCRVWPRQCKRRGAQLSRLTWHENGQTLFFGLWVHEGPMRMGQPEIHRLDFMGPCGASGTP